MDRPEDLLVAWRKGLELSQEAAAAMLRPPVSQQAWAEWENGNKPPSLHNAFEIERVSDGAIRAALWAKPHRQQRRRAKRARTGTDG